MVLRKNTNDNNYVVSSAFDYKPFGERINVDVSLDNINRTGFIAKEKDNESLLGDFGVRKYEDNFGRFTSIDPEFEKYKGWNPYHYSFNNPIGLKDITGNGPGAVVVSIWGIGTVGIGIGDAFIIVGGALGVNFLVTNGEKIRDASESLINTVTDAVNGSGNANSYIDKNVLGGASTPADASGTKVNVMEARNMAREDFSSDKSASKGTGKKDPMGDPGPSNGKAKWALASALKEIGEKWTKALQREFHLKEIPGAKVGKNLPDKDLLELAREFVGRKFK
jgi:RHS repeat-associated protein